MGENLLVWALLGFLMLYGALVTKLIKDKNSIYSKMKDVNHHKEKRVLYNIYIIFAVQFTIGLVGLHPVIKYGVFIGLSMFMLVEKVLIKYLEQEFKIQQ